MEVTEENEGASARDYGFLMFLTLLNVMNFVDRQLLASFANWIVPDLGLTNTQFGWLTGMLRFERDGDLKGVLCMWAALGIRI